jgi:hypothetical protein
VALVAHASGVSYARCFACVDAPLASHTFCHTKIGTAVGGEELEIYLKVLMENTESKRIVQS